jgi:hypothetical protein
VIGEYIEQREGTHFIAGSRVSLDSVVHGFLNGDSPESIRDREAALPGRCGSQSPDPPIEAYARAELLPALLAVGGN